MNYGLTEQVALVTGGTRGIGRACAALLAASGARVALCGRSPDAASEAAAGVGHDARGYAADVGNPGSMQALVTQVEAELGPISILVNNAGITKDGLLMRMKDADWRDVFQTNVDGAFYACRACSKSMLKQRYGRIINISSVVGLRGQAGQANYAAAKAALIGFTKAYAQEVGSRNITVNAVAPGLIETDMTADIVAKASEQALERIPLKRIGSPEDVAHAVAFLASPAAAYITGTVLTVDGGLAM